MDRMVAIKDGHQRRSVEKSFTGSRSATAYLEYQCPMALYVGKSTNKINAANKTTEGRIHGSGKVADQANPLFTDARCGPARLGNNRANHWQLYGNTRLLPSSNGGSCSLLMN
jgi:hypothetical protein